MAIVRTLSRSFAGGEVTPEMADRVDLGQYQTGLARCINAIIYPHGPAQKRGGMSFINWAKYWWEGDGSPVYDRNVNFVPFQFSADQSYMLEMGHQYVRFHTENGTLLEGVDITGEMIRSEGVNSGSPNRIAVMKKNHRLTAGKKIHIVASPVAPVGVQIDSIPADTAVCTGSVSGFTFTNTAHTSGSFIVGQYLFGTGIQPGTYITAFGTGVGDTGTYTVSHSITATGSITITGKAIYPMADNINKNDYWEISSLGSAFLGAPAGINYLLRAKRSDPYNIATSVAGSISGTTFTDTTHGDGAYAVGHRLFGVGIPDGTYITAMDPTGIYTGTGANNGGTYKVNNACTVTGIVITGRKEDATSWELVPLENWAQFDGVNEYTVENPDDDMFYIDVDSTLTSQPGPSISYTKISRAKKAKVTCLTAHGFNNDDLVYFTIENANPSTVNFDISIPYKVSDKTDTTFLLKYEVGIDDETGGTEWQYFNSKKAFKKKKIPIGKVGTGQLTPDVDISAVSYTIIREVFCYDENVFTQISHGFYSGQTVWLDPVDTAATRPDYYEVQVVDYDTFNLYEIDGAIVACSGSLSPPVYGHVYPVYEVATSYDHEDVQMLDFTQSYDVITITHKKYPTVTLSRFGAAEWLIEAEVFIPTIDIPSGCAAKLSGNIGTNTKTIYYAVTAVEGQDESFPAYIERPPIEVTKISNRIQYQAIPTFIGTGYYNNPTSISVLTGVGFKLASGKLPFGASIRLDAGDDMSDDFISAFEGEEMNDSYYRVVGILTSGWYIVSRRSKNAVDWVEFEGDLQPGDLNCYRSGSVSADFSVDTCKAALTWQAKPDTTYNVYKRVGGSGGDPLGYIGRSEIGFFTDDNITPDLSLTPPSGTSPFESENNYPACVDYFEQRKVFAGTVNRPQTIWMTRTASERNMLQSLPTRSTDSINFRMAGREQNAIKFMAALQDLIMFTENSEWRVGATEGSVLTPSSVSVKQQSANGCADVKPVVANNAILFVQSGSNRVLKLNYNWNAQSYAADDISMLSYHLFENKTITVMTLERGVFPILWCVRSDGILLALTFIPEQNVIAWHRHETDGEVIAARALKESSGPVVYLAVRRALMQGNRVLIERMDNYTNWLDRIYLDSQKTVTVAAIIDDDAQAIIDRMTVAPSVDTKLAINNLVLDLKTHGTWDKLDALQVYAAHTQQAGLLDWKRTGVSASLSGSATWDADDGIIGSTAASSYVNTAFTPSSDGVEFQLQDATMGCYVVAATTNAVGDEYYFGGRGSNSTYETHLGATSSTRLTARINSGTAFTSASSHRSDTGLLAVGVTGSADTVLSGSGVSLASGAAVESGLSTGAVYVGAKNNNGTVNGQCDARIAVWFAGSNLTLAQLAAFETAIEEYMAATPVGQTANLSGFMSLAGKTAHVKLEGSIYTGADADGYESYSSAAEQVVNSSGQVSIPALFFGDVTAGLKYDAEAKLLPVSFEAAAASRGTVKNISKVFLRANGQGTMYVGPNTDKLVGMIVDQAAAGEIPEIKEVPIVGDWNNDAGLLIKHSDPLPFMLQALVLEIATGG